MSWEARRLTFFQEMDKLRGQAHRLEATDIVRLAVKAGFTRREALRELRNLAPKRQLGSGEQSELLPTFMSSLCRQSGATSVLEYVSTASLLTDHLPDNSRTPQVTFSTQDANVAEILRVLGEGTSSPVVLGIPDTLGGSTYDLIICQPPLGHRPARSAAADGFGGEVVRDLTPLLVEEGTIYWVTGRGVLWAPSAKKTFSELQAAGFNMVATIDVAPGAFPETTIPGAVIALRRQAPGKRFVGALHDVSGAEAVASAFLAGPTRKGGPSWTWLDPEDGRTFADLEQARVLQELTPRGRHVTTPLASLLKNQSVVRADQPGTDEDVAAAYLFVPEYAGSRVTVDLDEQTVKPKAVYRLAIDPSKANPRFLAGLLNSPFGKHLRDRAAQGVTIQRVSATSLLSMELPIPDIATQDSIARTDSDMALLRASLFDMQSALDGDWTALPAVAEKMDSLKAVLDIERQIADWWRELPYPLATIYRRYQVSTDPKERLDTLFHFFEMAAVYFATVGASHVRAMRHDWQGVMAKWLHPPGAAGIERADFGFWIRLAGASLKDTSRIGSDRDLRPKAIELTGPELVRIAATIGSLGKATDVLDVARRYRNSWKGHGGHLKPSDAARLAEELQQSVRDLYEIAASTFRRLQLVRPGLAEGTETGLRYQLEKLSGSDPTFEKVYAELDRRARTNALAFWMTGARTMCRALPFFRLGAPQQPQETSFYVFNRVENGGCRWISYQEAREQEFVAPDDELLGLIALGRQ